MRLLLDTDAFCVLAFADLLTPLISTLQVDSCYRLPALPHMLRKGRLRSRLGCNVADKLLLMTEAIPALQDQDVDLEEQLVQANAIDPGEALLFSAAVQNQDLVLTGDKRAMRELKCLPSVTTALSGRIVSLEAALLVLLDTLGLATIRERLVQSMPLNRVVRICFSDAIENPKACLESYQDELMAEVAPIALWRPKIDQ